MDESSKYPRLERFLAAHPGWTLDDVLTFTENELKNKGEKEYESNPKAKIESR